MVNFVQRSCRGFLNCHMMDELSDYLRSRHVSEEAIQRMEREKVGGVRNV